ncbi:MAG: helicase [Alphaproteobacteria bacterium]|nr:helicase [Alphaproteobacteria bacterium]
MNVHFPAGRTLPPGERSKRVTAVLGPTNTGKTHLAIERMLAHSSGIIGLPLRLLAREVYNRVVEKVGAGRVALITGEEKIKPLNPSYWIATVEAMPRELDVAFVAVDEIQLAADFARGHVFTDRLLNRRGREETMLIGAATMTPLIEKLLPGARMVSRPRLSHLAFAGERKLSRLPRRTAIVAFSAEEVYAIAELIRRQRGGAAVVLGALSPRTRNAQVDMYQNGDVDYIVATDAIGMGLNLDVDHVAFAGDRKFDGRQYRRLNPAEFAQIAGRAGRHLRDGSFGTTGRCLPMEDELIEALESHRFDALSVLQWRNADLDFSSIAALQASLDVEPGEAGLTRAPLAEDVMVLDAAARDADILRIAATRADIARLWDACQIPDYRKVSPSAHAELALSIFHFIVRAQRIAPDWFARQLGQFDRVDGDIDALSARLAQVRTFNYIANRPDWLADPEHWQGVTRQVEDKLSDALHERLAHRFVDRRTSMLMRRLRENAMLEAEITGAGDVLVEGQHVGQLHGFRFTPDPQAEGEAQRTLNAAAQKALASEIESRATRVGEAVDDAFVLASDGAIRWLGEAVGKITAADHVLKPSVRVLADEQLTGPALETVQRRLDLWVVQHVKKLLGPLLDLQSGEGFEGLARGIAFQLSEALGVLDRSTVNNDVRALDQDGRSQLRKAGVRFGAYHIYLPALLKPAPRALAAQLWAMKNDPLGEVPGLTDIGILASSGRTSFPVVEGAPNEIYQVSGFRLSGERALRVDILERIADLIRPAIAYRPGTTPGTPPPGTADGDAFVVTPGMTSLAGCSGEAFASILRSLGYANETRKGPTITVALVEEAPRAPLQAVSGEEAATAETTSEETATAEAAGEAAADEAVVQESGDQKLAAPEDSGPEQVQEHAAAAIDQHEPAASAPEADEAGEAVADSAPEAAAELSTEAAPAEPETVEGEAAAAAPVVEDTPDIEVWRISRQRHGQRPERRRGQRRDRAGKASPANAPAKEPRVWVIPPAPAPKERPPRPERTAQAAQPHHEGQGAGGEARREGGKFPAGGREARRHDRPQRNDRKDRNDRDRSAGGALRQFASSEKSRGRDKAPDPDSPFAKLLALKQQLENKDGKG